MTRTRRERKICTNPLVLPEQRHCGELRPSLHWKGLLFTALERADFIGPRPGAGRIAQAVTRGVS